MPLKDFWDVLTVPGNPRVTAISGCLYTPGAALWYPLFPIYLTIRGVSPVEIGVLYALSLATTLVGTLVGGKPADRWGRKVIVIVSGSIAAVGTFALALPVAPYFLVGAIAWSISSFGFGFGRGAGSALLYESSQDRKGASMAAPYFLPSIVAIPMPFLGVLLSNQVGIAWLFILAGSLSSLSVVIKGIGLRETHHLSPFSGGGASKGASPRPGLSAFLWGPIGGVTLLYAVLAFSGWAFSPFEPLFFVKVLGSSVAFFGVLASIGMVIAGLLGFASGQLVDRIGPLKTAGYSMAGEAFCVSGLLLVKNVFLAGFLYESWYAVDFLDMVAPGVFIGGRTSQDNRASIMAAYAFITSIPSAFASGVGGVMFAWNPYSLLVMEVVVSAVGALAVLTYLMRSATISRSRGVSESGQ